MKNNESWWLCFLWERKIVSSHRESWLTLLKVTSFPSSDMGWGSFFDMCNWGFLKVGIMCLFPKNSVCESQIDESWLTAYTKAKNGEFSWGNFIDITKGTFSTLDMDQGLLFRLCNLGSFKFLRKPNYEFPWRNLTWQSVFSYVLSYSSNISDDICNFRIHSLVKLAFRLHLSILKVGIV